MCNPKVVLAVLALAATPAFAAEPLQAQSAAKTTTTIAQDTQRIERSIQSKIDAELMADIEAKAGINVVYQTARIIQRTPVPLEDEQRVARLSND